MKILDLRSDTVTKPCQAMRDVMHVADVGDDVYGEDPTTNALEAYAANLLGKESALLCPTGTQSNLVGLLAHCGRGDEYIVGMSAHTYLYEGGGAAVLGSIQPQPITLQADATMPLETILAAIKPDDIHFARTRLICLENTHAGIPLPLSYSAKVKTICDEHGLGLHLDGARLFHAAVKQNISVAELTKNYDSVSVCLSKGLGAPMGSLLVGSRDLVNEARRWRKILGGGMRQAGIIASAGLYALQNNVERLAEDHAKASLLGQQLAAIDGASVDTQAVQTNMVHVLVSEDCRSRLELLAKDYGVILPGGTALRLVTHLDIPGDDVGRIVDLFQQASMQ